MTTGKDRNPFEYASEDILADPVSSSSSSSTSSRPTVTAAPSQTAAVTISSTPTPAPEKKSNTVGIAVGAVAGVVVLLAIIGGVFFFLRQKKRREVEEEYRRQANMNSFTGGKLHTSNSSMTDSRLDPEFMHRRQSNGSIADNEDYSRRILKVRSMTVPFPVA
jgi:cell wall integrity and stress response component